MTNARRVLLTGANRGLGHQLARLLIDRGDRVWGTAREAAPEALLALGPAGIIQFDLADEASIVAGIAQLGEQVAGVDLVINCAGADGRSFGMADQQRGPFDFDAASFDAVNRVNVTGPMVVVREVLPLLRRGVDPLVLNISSQLGSMEVAASIGRDTGYCVSKAALNMLSVKSAAALAGEGIAVVMLHPGWVSTDMGGDTAPLTPLESATAIVETIDGLSLADSGRFVRWDGTTHPW